MLNSRGVGFVTYSNEANAQFAKEAMAHQSLDHNEILNVRWATQDPNPVAQGREKRRVEEQAAAAIRAALPEEFVRELEGRDPEAVKKRRIEGSFGLKGYEVPEEVWYARGERPGAGVGAAAGGGGAKERGPVARRGHGRDGRGRGGGAGRGGGGWARRGEGEGDGREGEEEGGGGRVWVWERRSGAGRRGFGQARGRRGSRRE